MFGLIAFALVLTNGAVYWPKIKALRVPLRPVGHQAVMVTGMGVAVVAFIQGPGVWGGLCAALALLVGGLFLFMTLASGMPHKVLADSLPKQERCLGCRRASCYCGILCL